MFKRDALAFNISQALLIASALAVVSISLPAYAANEQNGEPMTAFKTWRDLKVTESLTKDGSVNYYSFPLKNGTKAHLCVLDLKSKTYCVRPQVNTPHLPYVSVRCTEERDRGGKWRLLQSLQRREYKFCRRRWQAGLRPNHQ